MKLLLLSFSIISSFSFSQENIFEVDRYCVSLETGISFSSFQNNEYSKELSSVFTNNVDLTFSRMFGESFESSVGIHLAGYTHYNESSKEKLIELLDQVGDFEFGKLVFNDWGEWRIGMDYSRYFHINDRNLLNFSVIGDIVFGQRSKTVYTRNNNEFIYAYVPNLRTGFSLTAEIGYSWCFKKGYKSSVGIYYDFIYGYYPGIYEVRRGTGDDLEDNYVSYDFSDNFIISRHRLKIGLNLFISDLMN